MNPLVKKEIRLLLPSWSVAVLLALVQAIARPYDFYVASLLFFGLTIMALTTIGRETSLNTFSSLLAQPAERLRIWQIKLSVLAVAFLTVFVLWLACFFISGFRGFETNDYDSYNLFITICLIAAATFTGGLWTTLLLRQLAGAFWLTLLVPATLSGFSGIFLAQSESASTVIAVLCVVIAVYSVGGFLFARWLFFRAQDVGWSGGVIALPEWKIFASSENTVSSRNRKPGFALLKKEFQLHQITLMGAAGLLVLHLGVIILRKYHHFEKDSAGEILTSIFWMLWLVLAPVIGSMAVAEERRLGVMEGQFCLPISRRLQFVIKGVLTLCLGIFLGGVMPMLLEDMAAGLGAQNPALRPEPNSGINLFWLHFAVVSATTWLVMLSFFASTLSRSFLQAVGLGIATFFISFALLTTNGDEVFHGFMSVHSALPVVVAIPTIIATLLWLAYMNYKNFRPGWPLWRRNLLCILGAFIFINVASPALYYRVWEKFEPAEPTHGPAKLSLSNPPSLRPGAGSDFQVQLSDGRVWVFLLGHPGYLQTLVESPLPQCLAQGFIAGSNWVSVAVDYYFVNDLKTVGIQTDGSLWLSTASKTGDRKRDKPTRLGNETDWQQTAASPAGVLILKNDGTLWRWGKF